MAEPKDAFWEALAGRYELRRELGRGGMATVYLAEDVRHNRQVALKLLHPELAAVIGGERFLREIEIAAGLTNPHILPLHESGEANGLLFYVMPYVEGESLRTRLDRDKQLPVETALDIGTQVALALAHAHDRGVIHRDIKPENILLTGNQAVVADFGIARAVSAAGGQRITETGLSLGTPQYMSPEQAAGESDTDTRTDVYSLGCVLYEMLAGSPPFVGPNVQAIIAKVLTEPPPDVRSLRETVPPELGAVVHKAIARLPADRFQAAGEFARALERIRSAPTVRRQRAAAPVGKLRSRLAKLAVPAAAIVATALVMTMVNGRGSVPSATPVRFSVTFPDGFEAERGSPPLAISPDGKTIVYAARDEDGSQLFLRRIDAFESTPIPGTEGAHTPFFSPDGEWIGYIARRTVEKVSVSGGAPRTIGDAPFVSLGATWAPGFIVFAGVGTGLRVIPEEGGQSELLTNPNEPGDVVHGWPQAMPDGQHVMFTLGSVTGARSGLVNLATREVRMIEGLESGSSARYVPTGHVVYALANELFAAPFDVDRLEPIGTPVSVVPEVFGGSSGTFARFAYFSVSNEGALLYVAGGVEKNRLVWVDRLGATNPISAIEGLHYYPHVSPDGRRVVAQEADEIWIYDVERGTRIRLTERGGTDPTWTPDGERVAFSMSYEGRMSLHWIPADGSGVAELLHTRENPAFPHDWSPDGSALAFYEVTPDAARDILVLKRSGDEFVAEEFLVTPYNDRSPVFSPDGGWIAYVSDESGQDEVYARPYPGPGAKVSLSRGGGREPVWADDGREVFYRSGNRVMAVPVTVTGGGIDAGEPRSLFSGGQERYFGASGSQTYDVAAGGDRFVMTEGVDMPAPVEARVVLNWFAELARLAPRGER